MTGENEEFKCCFCNKPATQAALDYIYAYTYPDKPFVTHESGTMRLYCDEHFTEPKVANIDHLYTMSTDVK